MEFFEGLRFTLKAALLPPGLLALMLFAGLLWHRHWFGRLLSWASLLALYLLSTAAATGWLAPLLETYPPRTGEQLRAAGAQAILLLSAGYDRNTPELDWQARPDAASLQRASYALKLHRDSGLPLVISGGVLREGDQAVAKVLARWLRQRAQVEPLALETRSLTTWENARYSAPLLRKLGIGRVALVTHAYHMPRAMLSAQAHGIDAIAAPMGFMSAPSSPLTEIPSEELWRPDMRAFGANYLLLHELAGAFWYNLKK